MRGSVRRLLALLSPLALTACGVSDARLAEALGGLGQGLAAWMAYGSPPTVLPVRSVRDAAGADVEPGATLLGPDAGVAPGTALEFSFHGGRWSLALRGGAPLAGGPARGDDVWTLEHDAADGASPRPPIEVRAEVLEEIVVWSWPRTSQSFTPGGTIPAGTRVVLERLDPAEDA